MSAEQARHPCGEKTVDGGVCRRLVPAGAGRCWQHAESLRSKWNALTKFAKIAVTVILALATLCTPAEWYFARTPKIKSVSILPVEESLQVGAAPGAGDYIQKVGGIEWKAEYSELQISFSNPTSSDFSNLDFTVLPDLMITGYGEVTHFDAQFIANGSNIPLPPDINQRLDEKRKSGEGYKVALPMSLTNMTRFRCATLPRHSILIIILALVNRPARQDGVEVGFSAEPNGPKALPKHLSVKGTYQAGAQPYELNKEFKF